MSTKEDALQKAIEEMAVENPGKALSLLVGNFIGLITAMIANEGGDYTQELTVLGAGGCRDITVHAAKTATESAGEGKWPIH